MLIIFLLLFSSAFELHASCCSSSASAGVGRLLPHERALVELSQDARLALGTFNSQHLFIRGMPAHLPHWQFNHELQVMARLTSFFLPFIKIPVRTQLSSIRSGSYWGDLSFGARWPLSLGFNILSSFQAPTGSVYNTKTNNYIENITGLGAWLWSLGLNYDYAINNWLINTGYNFSFEPRVFKSTGFANGPQHMPFLSIAYPVHNSSLLSATISALFTHPAKRDNINISESTKRKISISLGYNLKIHSHVSFITSLGSDIPLSYWGQNTNSEIFIRLALRIGIF